MEGLSNLRARLEFITNAGRTLRMNIQRPRLNLTAEQAANTMSDMIEAGVLLSASAGQPRYKAGASITAVDRNTLFRVGQ